MNVGFDLDKVLINYPPFVPDWVIDKLYKEKDNGVLSYRIPGKMEQFLRLVTHYRLFRLPIKDNMAFIHNLNHKKDNKYYLISSRFGFLQTVTSNLVKRHRLEKAFDGIYFNFDNKQPHEFKNQLIKKLHIHRYVDDDLSLLRYLAHHNPDTTFYWLTPFRHRTPKEPNVIPITKLPDVMK